jgi:hypothetical protein
MQQGIVEVDDDDVARMMDGSTVGYMESASWPLVQADSTAGKNDVSAASNKGSLFHVAQVSPIAVRHHTRQLQCVSVAA